MNNFEAYLVELLQGHLTYDNENVEVVKHFSNAPSLPVVTLDLSGGTTTDWYWHEFDDEGHDILWQHCTSNINISLWCNAEGERQNLTEQILDCFHKEKQYHYSYCSNYTDGLCGYGGSCRAINLPIGAKQVCPDPDTYGYESLRSKHGVLDNTVRLEPPFDMDEFDKQPPLLRSIFRCSGEYERIVNSDGLPYDDIVVGDFEIAWRENSEG